MNPYKSPLERTCFAIGRSAGQLAALSLLAMPFVLFIRWLIWGRQ